ncbi:MAG: pseudouridine synthase [Pseudomonadota bacterium]|nr:pseudouridine synthase [Pseudomonadota bacterium]
MSQVLLFNKPFNVLSQFTDKERANNPRKTLTDFLKAPQYRAAGRLDYDSEGLLILTMDGALQHQLANPLQKQWKTYWVQVEGEATPALCQQLSVGIDLKDGRSLPARCKLLEIPTIWDRNPPIRYRASIPDSWIELSLQEGRNRQVRRMTAAAGFPTLRLIRMSIGPFHIGDLQPGESRYEPASSLRSIT